MEDKILIEIKQIRKLLSELVGFNKDLKRYHQIEHFDTTILSC